MCRRRLFNDDTAQLRERMEWLLCVSLDNLWTPSCSCGACRVPTLSSDTCQRQQTNKMASIASWSRTKAKRRTRKRNLGTKRIQREPSTDWNRELEFFWLTCLVVASSSSWYESTDFQVHSTRKSKSKSAKELKRLLKYLPRMLRVRRRLESCMAMCTTDD